MRFRYMNIASPLAKKPKYEPLCYDAHNKSKCGAVSANSGNALESRKRSLNDGSITETLPRKVAKIEPSTFTANSASKCFHGFLEKVKPRAHMFELMSEIGRGTCGRVYRAKCATQRKCEIAIKVIPMQGCQGYNAKKEEKTIKCLMDKPHPNIIEFFGSFDENSENYIVMELGQVSLKQFLAKNISHLSISQFHEMIYQIFEILNHLDSIGVLYNDFKFDNMVYFNGRIKLIDFGSIIEKESTCYEKYGGPLSELKNAGYLLAKMQLEMKCKSKNEKYYQLSSKFAKAFKSKDFTESDAKSLLDESDIWHEELPIETRKILSRCFIDDRLIRREVIEKRNSIIPRSELVY